MAMDLSRINLNLLPSLQQLLRTRSVTVAAEKLRVTQSAMSKNLAQLRKLLHDPLLVRVGNQMQLTEQAGQLSRQLEGVLGEVEKLFSSSGFDPATSDRRFVLAATDYVCHFQLPVFLEQLRQKAPSIRLDVQFWASHRMEALFDGSVHLATSILENPPEDIFGQQIGEDNFVCLMSKNHPLAAGEMSLDQWCDADHIAVAGGGDKIGVIDEVLAGLGKKRRIEVTLPFITAAAHTLEEAGYILTMPRHMAAFSAQGSELVTRELPFESPRVSYYLIWHRRFHEDPGHIFLRRSLFAVLQASLYSHQLG